MRRGGTISLSGVYGGMADPLPMLSLFDKQVQLRMGQANVHRWVPEILPLLRTATPSASTASPRHHLPLDEAPEAYEMFQKKEDGREGAACTRRATVAQPLGGEYRVGVRW